MKPYNGAPPHVAGSETSKAAADSMVAHAPTLRSRVLNVIRSFGAQGATDDELEQEMGLSHQTLSARRRELYLDGHLVEVGKRPTRSGRNAIAWKVRTGA